MSNTEVKSVALSKEAVESVGKLAKITDRTPHYWLKRLIEEGVKKELIKKGK